MFETVLLIAFILYSVFSIFLSLKVGKIEEKEKEKQSLAFKFVVIYGTFVVIIFPTFCLLYFLIKLLVLFL